MGRYIQPADVQIRLLGKVKFTDDQTNVNAFQNTLLAELIDQAEGQVEIDLSPRYAAPLTGIINGTPVTNFTQLQKPYPTGSPATYSMIRALCQYQSVVRVLEYDFGRSTAISGEKYIEKMEARYKNIIEKKLLAKKKIEGHESQQWQFPPLPLQLNYMNTTADDGYMGQVLNTTQVKPQYPQFQINDPAETYFNGSLDDPFRGIW